MATILRLLIGMVARDALVGMVAAGRAHRQLRAFLCLIKTPSSRSTLVERYSLFGLDHSCPAQNCGPADKNGVYLPRWRLAGLAF